MTAFLNADQFNQLLNRVGQAFLWRKATACPCLDAYSGQPKPDCTHCLGKGRIWADPIEAGAGVVSRQQIQKMAGFGFWDDGDIMISIPSDSPLYDIGGYDRVTMLNRTEPFSQVVVAGVNDTLRYTITQIDGVSWIDGGDNLINGDIPEIINGVPVWGGLVPPVGQEYTLTGRRFPEYFCYQEQPLDRPHQFGEPLPRRVVLKRFDVMGR